MLSQIIISQFEIKTTNEYLGLGVLEYNLFLTTSFYLLLILVNITILIFSCHNNIRIWLLYIL